MAKCLKCGNEIRRYEYKGITFELCKDCGTVIISRKNFETLATCIDTECQIVDLFSLQPIMVKKEVRTCCHCGDEMEQVYCEGVLIDRCKKCDLLLFDNGELSKYFSIFSKMPIEIMSNAKFIKTFCDNGVVPKQPKKERKQETENTGDEYMENREVERAVASTDGWFIVGIEIVLALIAFGAFMLSVVFGPFFFVALVCCVIVMIFFAAGFKVIKPQEAIIFTLFGKYYGTLRNAGFYWVLPFAAPHYEHISLKVRTLENPKQKINDFSGNPIEVGIMVTWEVQDTAKAVFNVNDYEGYLSSQCDSALRNTVRLYPYDAPEDSNIQSLKDDSAEICEKLKLSIQKSVSKAGINIIDARITHLAYSKEIAAAMLQRQQANAIIDARRAIVDGAVGMVEMAIDKLSKNENIKLDDKTKASMVNNLLVVLCGNKESQPVVRNDVIE